MTRMVGSNRNTTDEVTHATVGVNPVTATVLLAANPDRLYAKVSLDGGVLNQEAFIREYPAATDNIKTGELLIREISANHSLFKSLYETIPGNVYTGEISAIAVAGSFNVHVMEG